MDEGLNGDGDEDGNGHEGRDGGENGSGNGDEIEMRVERRKNLGTFEVIIERSLDVRGGDAKE